MSDTISVQCPKCSRRVDGTERAEWDPPHAALFVVLCPDCAIGCKVDGGEYYDADGNEIDWFEWNEAQKGGE